MESMNKSAGAMAYQIRNGPLVCDNPPLMEDFNAHEFQGVWHLVSRTGGKYSYIESFDNMTSFCYADEIEFLNPDTGIAKLWKSWMSGASGYWRGEESYIRFEKDGSGVFHLGTRDSEYRQPRRVLDTDYKNYAILYECEPSDYEQNVEIYARDS